MSSAAAAAAPKAPTWGPGSGEEETLLLRRPDAASNLMDWSSFPELVHPLGGHLPEKRLLKKCQQLENLAKPVVDIVKGKSLV